MPRTSRTALTLLAAAFSLLAMLGCGDDDPTRPTSALGSASNPERILRGVAITKTLAVDSTYYLVFETSTAGDYSPSVASDQPMAWSLYRDPGSRSADPADWTLVGSCGTLLRVGDATCTMTGLDAATDYVLEVSNRGTADANYTLMVTP